MIEEKIPVLLLQWDDVARLGRRMRGVGKLLAKPFPKLGPTLEKLGIEVDAGEYAVGSLVSSLMYGILLSLLAAFALTLRASGGEVLPITIAVGLGIWLMFFLLHMVYPSIILKKIAIKQSRDMLFALRELLIDVKSGIPLYWSMKNVAEAEYGYVSKDFAWVSLQIERGVPEKEALKSFAVKTESEHLKRAVWQMVNALESGSSLSNSLEGIVQSVEEYVYRDIKNYSSNLNFLMLLYMFAAAVIPSLGVTFLVLLSAFSDFGITIETIGLLILTSIILQLIMIGYMGSTRPEIFGG